jgi:hypothetical protein
MREEEQEEHEDIEESPSLDALLEAQRSRIKNLPDALRVDMQRRRDELQVLEQEAIRLWIRMDRDRIAQEHDEKNWKSDGRRWLWIGSGLAVVTAIWKGIGVWWFVLATSLILIAVLRVLARNSQEKRADSLQAQDEALAHRWTTAGNQPWSLARLRRILDIRDGQWNLREPEEYDRWQYEAVEHHLRKLMP